MPLTNGFNLLDFGTYGYLEWGFVALVAILVIVLLVLIFKPRKHKGNVSKSVKKTNKNRIVYYADNGESVVFFGQDAWHISPDGLTDNYKAIDWEKARLEGKVVYLSKSIKKVTVTQTQTEIVKRAAMERQFITFDFISKNEVKLGQRLFLTKTGQIDRAKREEIRTKREEKSQALADKKADAIQRKADKRLKKEEKKAEKLAKQNEEKFEE